MIVVGPSPRVRGSRRRYRNALDIPGSIPACAGEPLQSCKRSAPCRVHPRVCGGASRACCAVAASMGPSPRVRGSLIGSNVQIKLAGSIPACAGEPALELIGWARNGVHPRVCGGAAWAMGLFPDAEGPSPRVRGSPALSFRDLKTQGSIPACAGEPAKIVLPNSIAWVHPRVCGGAMVGQDVRELYQGPSPRVRWSPWF